MKIAIQATVSHDEMILAIGRAVCGNVDFRPDEWSLHDAETLEAAARIIRESRGPTFAEARITAEERIERLLTELADVKFLHANQMQNALDLKRQCEQLNEEVKLYRAKDRKDSPDGQNP